MRSAYLFFFSATIATAFSQPLTPCVVQEKVALQVPSAPLCNTLAAGLCYEGKPYTHSAVWRNGEGFNCTTYMTKILMDAGYSVDQTVQKMVNIVGLPSQEEIEKAVTENRSIVAGVVWALAATEQGTALTDTDELQPGDLIQFWFRNSAGLMRGHAAQVAARLPDGRFSLHGAHGSSKSGSVCSKAFSLSIGAVNSPGNTVYSVYAVRPKGNAQFPISATAQNQSTR